MTCILVRAKKAILALQEFFYPLSLSSALELKSPSEHKYAVLFIYVPWCSYCKELAPEYSKATDELSRVVGKNITLLRIDASRHSRSEGRFPALTFYYYGSRIGEYDGPWDSEAIVKAALDKFGYRKAPPAKLKV